MKRFITRLLLFCCVPLLLLVPLAYFVDKGLRQSRGFSYAEWNDLFAGNINADGLVMGSSRAWVNFSPAILDSVLGLNTYNLGMDGAHADLQFERLKIYLRYNKAPKFIIQEVGLHTVTAPTTELPNYQQFLPYLSDTSIWRVYQTWYNNVSIADRYFPLYKYNNQLPTIKEGILSYMGKGVAPIKYKGYQGQLLQWDSSFSNFKKTGSPYDMDIKPEALDIFRNYMRFCKERNIEVVLVYAPFYYEAAGYIGNFGETMNILRGIGKEYDMPFLDYTQIYIDSNTKYFYNSQHLNKEGAELFSHMVANDVKQYIK